MIRKTVELESLEFYKKHLGIINNLLPVSLGKKELEVLATFLHLPEEITKEDMFNSLARKKVREILKLSPAALSNHLSSIISKGFVVKLNGKITPKHFLVPNNDKQEYYFKLINKK